MMLSYVVILMGFINVELRFLPLPDLEHLEDIAEETQHAMCKIASDDLKATANATITRQLKGVCTTSYLDTRIKFLEQILISELNNIKNLLKSQLQPAESLTLIPKNHLKSVENQPEPFLHSQRDQEIQNQNMTIEKYNSGIKFQYFWRINNILPTLSRQNQVESGDFYFSGNHLYIQMFPNYLQTKSVLIEAVSIENFNLKHQFSVLDQITGDNDIISPVLSCGTKCTGFQIAHDSLYAKNYILNDVLIVKLLIFLDMD